MSSTTLLFDEPPIAFSPTLARLIGLHEAILLQQIHYWLHHKSRDPGRYQDYYIDGRFWVKWNIHEMMEYVPLGKSADPYKRTVKLLKEQSILLVAQHWKSRYINTNFYSIDYQNLELLIRGSSAHGASGNATEGGDESPLSDELKNTETTRANSTHLNSKNSSEIEDFKNPPPLLDTTDLPTAIRKAAADLASQTNKPQDYIDLLTARLRRNQELPVEQQIQQPLAWLKRVIQNEKMPDFTPAWKIQEERRAAKALLSGAREKEQKDGERTNIPSLIEGIQNEDQATREKWIETHLSKLIFSKVKEQIRSAVLTGKRPSTRSAEILLVQFMNLARGESK